MSKEFKLSRRKALAGIGGIGVASAGAGLGTSAFFSDQEPFEGNSITAGELDLRIDWQQLYFGPEENTDNYEPYGTAGRPFVNAHPDAPDDPTGEQSLNSDEFDTVDDDGIVRYSDEDANIQEYLTCETLDNFEVPEDFDNGVRTQDSLIELEDVKPGDCGEVTFSLHLCDNPGYIWWIGQVDDYDEELAKAIKVKAWYDLECTNELDEDDGDKVLVETTDLHTFLDDRLEPEGRFLNPNVYDAGVGGDSALDGEPEVDCNDLDKIEFEEDGPVMDGDGDILDIIVEDGELKVIALFAAPDDDETEIIVQFSELIYKDDDDNEVLATSEDEIDWEEVVEYDWDILDEFDGTETTDDAGMCEKTIKSGTAEETDDLITSIGCTTGQTNVRTPGTGPKEQPQGISFVEFQYCSEESPPLCFPEEETFCVAFEWCLPTTTPEHVDDINELQGKSIDFDLGFYTEQCRHNEDPSGPSGFS